MRRAGWAALAGLLLAALSASPARAAVRPPIKRVILAGDSLMLEAHLTAIAQMPGSPYKIIEHGTIGHAPCDYLKSVQSQSATAVLMTIETAGNSRTKCMKDANGVYLPMGSQAWKDKYRADMNALFQLTTLHPQLREIVFIPAPFTNDAENTLASDVFPLLETDAANYAPGAITFSDAPRLAVSDGGGYAQTLPCLPSEGGEQGCTDGRIAVRAPDGTHFCPSGLYSKDKQTGCAMSYSSGAVRFGLAIAQVVNDALGT